MFLTRATCRQPVQASVDSTILSQYTNFMRKLQTPLKLGTKFLNNLEFCSHIFAIHFEVLFTELRKATVSFVVSVCPSAWDNSVPTQRIFFCEI